MDLFPCKLVLPFEAANVVVAVQCRVAFTILPKPLVGAFRFPIAHLAVSDFCRRLRERDRCDQRRALGAMRPKTVASNNGIMVL